MDAERLKKYQQRLYSPTRLIGGWLQRKAVEKLARDGSPEAVRVLAETVTHHDDEQVCALALEALQNLADQRCIDAVCAVWAETRNSALAKLMVERNWVASAPIKVRVLSALNVGRVDVVTMGGADVVESLLDTCGDIAPDIARQAHACLVTLQNADGVDAICKRWATKREPLLMQAIVQAGYVARKPIEVRVWSALKAGKLEVVTEGEAEVVGPLFMACEDADHQIAEHAQISLQQLKNPEAQETICRLVIEDDHALAREVAVAAQYTLRDPHQRALFYFLTDQWEKYESLDFDHTMLRTVYEVGDEGLRKRIAEKARQAGRMEFVEIVSQSRDQRDIW
ncbi:MAG: hypothetical protein HY314_13655 [Acidobacteria bacterium]|nr:hypothetical protein [Acidobacteriota bacterium]